MGLGVGLLCRDVILILGIRGIFCLLGEEMRGVVML